MCYGSNCPLEDSYGECRRGNFKLKCPINYEFPTKFICQDCNKSVSDSKGLYHEGDFYLNIAEYYGPKTHSHVFFPLKEDDFEVIKRDCENEFMCPTCFSLYDEDGIKIT